MTTITTKYPFVGSIETKQGGRKENQDNAGFVDTPLGFLVVVCDGMGGGPGGRTASHMAVDAVLTTLSGVSAHTPREAALKFAISRANDVIYSKAKETPELQGMGTTIAAVLINENSAVVAHAGDTRVYQLRTGTIIYRTADHSVVANLVRQKKLTEEEARNHPQSNIITRALGIRPIVDIEFDEVSFLRGDRFVICTDGIWGMIPQRDLIKSLSRVMGIGELTALTAEEIDNIGRENGGGHDNLTLAVIDSSFDSSLKKKYPSVSHSSLAPERKLCRSVFYQNRLIWILLIICTVSVILYLILCGGTLTSSYHHKKDITGRVETTVTDGGGRMRDKKTGDEARRESSSTQSNDSTSERKKRESVNEQIQRVVQSLDSLKGIEAGKKNFFVKKIIKPRVESLKTMVEHRHFGKVDEILNLLDDDISISSSSKGERYIEAIKSKIKKMRE